MKCIFLVIGLVLVAANALADPCRPISTIISLGDFNVTTGILCSNDGSPNYYISTTASNGQEIKVDSADPILKDLGISPKEWSQCMETVETKGLSDDQRPLVSIAQQILIGDPQEGADPSTTISDAKQTLAQICAK